MSQELVIYGAGGLGREVAVMIEQINAEEKLWDVIGFCDDGIEKNTIVDGLTVIGDCEYLNTVAKPLSVAIAVAEPALREKIVRRISNKSISFPILIHPSVNLGSPTNVLGQGCIVTAGCILTTNVQIADFSFINLATTIGHDVSIGTFSSIMPGVHVSGSVTIGECCLVGTGAVILQGLSVGSRAKVGAGAVVTRNVKESTIVVGVPARKIK